MEERIRGIIFKERFRAAPSGAEQPFYIFGVDTDAKNTKKIFPRISASDPRRFFDFICNTVHYGRLAILYGVQGSKRQLMGRACKLHQNIHRRQNIYKLAQAHR